MKPPAFISEDTKQVALELGEALMLPAFGRIIDLLEQYETTALQIGIDDPTMTKDYLQGAVHASRMLRSTLSSARDYYQAEQAREQELVEVRRNHEFLRPGGGPGTLS